MLRSTVLAVVGVIVLSATSLLADDAQKPKVIDKSEVKEGEPGQNQKDGQKDGEKSPAKGKEAEKGKQKEAAKGDKAIKGERPKDGEKNRDDKNPTKDGDKTAPKKGEKRTAKDKPVVAVIGNATEYYTTSPAQGRPADGKLQAGTKVRILEKSGSYVRVVAQIEAFVPANSLKEIEKKDVAEKKGGEQKEGIKKPVPDKEALLKKKAAAGKDKLDVVKAKAAPVKKGEKTVPEK